MLVHMKQNLNLLKLIRLNYLFVYGKELVDYMATDEAGASSNQVDSAMHLVKHS